MCTSLSGQSNFIACVCLSWKKVGGGEEGGCMSIVFLMFACSHTSDWLFDSC